MVNGSSNTNGQWLVQWFTIIHQWLMVGSMVQWLAQWFNGWLNGSMVGSMVQQWSMVWLAQWFNNGQWFGLGDSVSTSNPLQARAIHSPAFWVQEAGEIFHKEKSMSGIRSLQAGNSGWKKKSPGLEDKKGRDYRKQKSPGRDYRKQKSPGRDYRK